MKPNDTSSDIIEKLQKELKDKERKIAEQEAILRKNNLSQIDITDEEIICTTQINILRQKSDERELSLEEIKKLDIIIKNYRLISGKKKDDKSDKDDIPDENLIHLVQGDE